MECFSDCITIPLIRKRHSAMLSASNLHLHLHLLRWDPQVIESWQLPSTKVSAAPLSSSRLPMPSSHPTSTPTLATVAAVQMCMSSLCSCPRVAIVFISLLTRYCSSGSRLCRLLRLLRRGKMNNKIKERNSIYFFLLCLTLSVMVTFFGSIPYRRVNRSRRGLVLPP